MHRRSNATVLPDRGTKSLRHGESSEMGVALPSLAGEVLLRLEEVEQFYDQRIRILGPLDLEVRSGEFLSVVGPSGCGKSTLLRIAAGVLRPTHGRVRLRDRPLHGVNRSAAMVFQSFALFPWL